MAILKQSLKAMAVKHLLISDLSEYEMHRIDFTNAYVTIGFI
jgi:hypothetical protein